MLQRLLGHIEMSLETMEKSFYDKNIPWSFHRPNQQVKTKN